jgi:hypothetical protein
MDKLWAGIPTHSEAIADWIYTTDEWRRFGSYEGRHFHKMLRQTRTAFFVVLVLTILSLLAVPLFGILAWAPWDRGMAAAVFLIMLFGGGLLGVAALVWMVQRSKLRTLEAATGGVIITLHGISTSGIWHRWNYHSSLGQRFYDARTMVVNKGKPDEMELLEVRTIANTQGPNSAREVISSCRVPIPRGRSNEAIEIVRLIEQEKARHAN